MNHLGEDMTDVVAFMQSSGDLSEDESNILKSYFQAMEASGSYESFVNYSISAEEIIVNSSYSDETKQMVLSIMSTARFDLKYWYYYEE